MENVGRENTKVLALIESKFPLQTVSIASPPSNFKVTLTHTLTITWRLFGLRIEETVSRYGGRDSSRYGDSLRGGRSGDRIPVGATFSAPVQTGPVAQTTFYTVGTESFFRG